MKPLDLNAAEVLLLLEILGTYHTDDQIDEQTLRALHAKVRNLCREGVA